MHNLQDPTAELRRLCAALKGLLRAGKYLLIVDDVWKEDFDLFKGTRLGLLSLQAGSGCVITSRHSTLIGSAAIHHVRMASASQDCAEAILRASAYVGTTPTPSEEAQV